ncbi:MAG: UvrD-helicase domain-containing protein [Chloroflexi bacterium]|nr:UvrD-helicase domain-containing protein [Chloroflexota bacterium]
MVVAEPGRWITRIDRMWMLPPFKKALEKRQRETTLLVQLNECVDQLFRDPTHSGLNLETLHHTGDCQILSARITRASRLILTPLAKTEVGLLYFDNHAEAYQWVDRNRNAVPTMLTRTREVQRGVPLSASFNLVPVVQADEASPLAIASAEQFRRMVDDGVARYLTFLDEEQRRLAELNVAGLLLVKGGAGTGKTAVAIHRVLDLVRQPALIHPNRVLYLCFNSVLARVVRQLLRVLCHGAVPGEVEVKTFHAWCREFLNEVSGSTPQVDDERCQQAVYRAFGQLAPEARAALGELDGQFVDEEIEQVIEHNGLASLEQYLGFSRQGRRVSLKRAARAAVWEVHERAQRYQADKRLCRWSDLPLLALAALEARPDPPQYRAVVIDEGQDCSPVMVRLARRLVAQAGGSLTVFADPAQAIYECGFQWTQHELRPAGGNVRWLRKTYRTTHEIFELARPLLDGHEGLQDDLAQMERPARRGARPCLVVSADEQELRAELVERVARAAAERPLHQVAVLAAAWRVLEELAAALEERNVPAQFVSLRRGAVRIDAPAVKLLTIQSAKGLDFPVVFVVGPGRGELGGLERAQLPETRRTLYVALTRASEALTIGAVYGRHHPLLEVLDAQCYQVEGSHGRAFVNLRGKFGEFEA